MIGAARGVSTRGAAESLRTGAVAAWGEGATGAAAGLDAVAPGLLPNMGPAAPSLRSLRESRDPPRPERDHGCRPPPLAGPGARGSGRLAPRQGRQDGVEERRAGLL